VVLAATAARCRRRARNDVTYSNRMTPAAQIELGKLLAMAQAGRQPDSDVTVAQLLDQYA
jgi:hypothetical protein